MLRPEYASVYGMPAGMNPSIPASLEGLHPFFPQAREPEAPLSKDDVTLFMLLVTYSDALDALPLETTRSFSDLRELNAVLGAHLESITQRLHHLASVIEDPNVSPGQRLMVLKEAAEEARAYKMGGEDKIRVAVNTSDMLESHTDYIDSILRSLTSLPMLAPYIQESRPQYKHLSELSAYGANSEPYPPGPSVLSGGVEINAMNVPPSYASFPDISSNRARIEREPQPSSRTSKKRKVPPQSVGSSRSGADRSGITNGSKRRETGHRDGFYDDDHAESSDDQGEAYETSADRFTRPSNRSRGRESDVPTKQTTATWSGRRVLDGPMPVDGVSQADVQRTTSRSRPNKTSNAGSNRDDQDDQRYCFCNNYSYGDMIGCDDDDCEREWFHLGCVGLSKPPQGTWYCDACLERRSQQSRNKTKRNARPARSSTAAAVVADMPASTRRVTAARR